MNSNPHARAIFRLALAVIAVAALALPTAAGAATKRIVKEGRVPSLGRVLTTNRGHTLYSLSVEQKGRFICTNDFCLSLWHPLVVRRGTKPTGPVALGTVRRPDGRTQVTFEGRPLYVFDHDKNAGEAKGEGFKDVGTWHVASP